MAFPFPVETRDIPAIAAACVSRVGATVHFWEREERGTRHDRSHAAAAVTALAAINEITVSLPLPPPPYSGEVCQSN